MPRSPSRDRSDRFAGRRGYFRRLDTLSRLKVLLAAVAAIFATGWMAADSLWPKGTQAAHTHGELADPHANLSDRCEACHKPFAGGEASPFAAGSRWRAFDCTKCHAGSAHHASTRTDVDAHNDCGSCHADHKGKTNSLTRVTDSHCTGCHKDLSKHPADDPMSPSVRSPITGFVTSHPDFAALDKPPVRTLKFSHALHMTAGLSYTDGGKEALTASRVKELYGEAAAERYTRYEGGKLQLDCRDCHRPDASGRHHAPVNYETSCKTCHPLTAPTWVTGDRVVVKGFEVPHRTPITPGDGKALDLKAMLTAGYLGQMVADNPRLFTPPAEPGGRTDPERPKKLAGIKAEVDRVAGSAAELLADGGCGKCHDRTVNGVEPLPRRTGWLPLASFNHTPHLGPKPLESCKSCHPGTAGAFTPDGRPAEKEPLQVLGIDSCRACHAPKGSSPTAGVKHGCVDCHSYHRR